MGEEKLISVVVPIYNVEKYLRECVDSILAQTHKNLEIILVDDGSPDNCPKICDEYAAKDSRVKVIHKENGGLGAAYNTGIAAANGDYLGLVESDDWIEPDMYERLLESALKFDSDVVKANFFRYDSYANPKDKVHAQHAKYALGKLAPENKGFNITEYPKLLFFYSSIWTTLYKMDFAKGLKFQETRSAAYQDISFMMAALMKAKTISIVNKPLLHYRQEAGNASSVSRTDDRLIAMADQFIFAYDELHNLPAFSQCFEEVFYHAVEANFSSYQRIEDKYKKAYFERIRQALAPIKTRPDFSFKYSEDNKKEFALAVLAGDFERANNAIHAPKISKYLFGAFKIEKKPREKSFFLFGHKIYSKKK